MPADEHAGAWVFAYGSLMWDQGFAHEASHSALVHGWHRRFSLLSTQSWGSVEAPGLSAALHPGGSVWGRAYWIAGAAVLEARSYLAAREAAYRHIEVTAHGPGGASVPALTFAWNPENARFAARIGLDEQCRLIRQGLGEKGSSRGYLEGVEATLREDGRACRETARLIAALAASGPA